MQYHLNGFRPGDPSLSEAEENAGSRPDQVDVLIIGCGPAGLMLAAQLARFPDITTRIAERKSGPMKVGQADGIACRSVEMFQALGFAEKVIKEGYHVNEVSFWRPGAEGGVLQRADRIADVEDDLSEMPHVILSQARLHDFFLEAMLQAPTRLTPDYGHELTSLTRHDGRAYPLEAGFRTPEGDAIIHARYVVGCDGARSAVRGAMGVALVGDAARQLWGVMDVLAITDFPDIRLKVAIQSAAAGAMLIIPREGGYMVRMYIELDALKAGERAADRGVTQDMLIAKGRDILAPYRLDVKAVPWWSAYEIGQRVCDVFDDRGPGQDPRIFIAGDACHTHSPKAGQGMNVSMADTFNLGWKLAAVLRGQSRATLLETYANERRAKAVELIDFDRDMARLFSSRPETPEQETRFQAYFKQHGRYTAGVETRYDPSMIIGNGPAPAGLPLGKRFHSAPVIRLADAKPMQLCHVARADGRWRLFVFAGAQDRGQGGGAVDTLCRRLEDPTGPMMIYRPPNSDFDGFLDLRVIFQQGHRDLDIGAMPDLLLRGKGRYGLIDYEKIFCVDPVQDIFVMRGIDRENGVAVLVRPDQFVAEVAAVSDVARIAAFLDRFMIPQG